MFVIVFNVIAWQYITYTHSSAVFAAALQHIIFGCKASFNTKLGYHNSHNTDSINFGLLKNIYMGISIWEIGATLCLVSLISLKIVANQQYAGQGFDHLH